MMNRALRKIQFILLIGLVWSMTFSFDAVRLTSLFTILVAAATLASVILAKDFRRPRQVVMMLLFISLFIIHIVGFAYSENVRQAAFELEKKLSLLVFPLAIFYAPRLEPKEMRWVLLSFVGSCIVTLCVCLAIASYRWFGENNATFLSYHSLSEIAGMHAAYLSMYFCFSVAIILFLYHDDLLSFRLRKKTLAICAAVGILILGILLLSARMQLIILSLGLIVYVFVRSVGKYGPARSASYGLGVGLVTILVILMFPVNRERFKQLINYKNEYSLSSKWGEQQMRPLVWSCALEVIATEPLKGVGIGDGEDVLQECYIRNNYGSLTYFSNARFNAHNQFLETTIQLGFVGLFGLVLSIAVPFFLAMRGKNVLYMAFILVFVLSGITESMLERQSGIAFFAFFNSFLFFDDSRYN